MAARILLIFMAGRFSIGRGGLAGHRLWFVFGSHFVPVRCANSSPDALAPLTIATIWFSFGTAAIEQAKSGTGALANGIGDVSLVLFQLFEALPMGESA